MMSYLILPTCLLVFASFFDIKSKKVPNSFVLVALSVILINLVIFKPNSFIDPILGFATALMVMMPLYLLGALGAADVKIFSLFGLLTNTNIILHVFLLSLLAAALIGVIKAILEKKHLVFATNMKLIFSLQKPQEKTTTQIPYTVALLFGWMIFLVYDFYGRWI